ncbi:MAG: hypothetical protein FJX74_09030 [Armatimonadetes bacterium]|nr:hypothetical protein [Armatimonadota bacterium]
MNRRFRPVIGPGLIIALGLCVFLVWRRMQPPEVARPVVIQHEGAIAATGVPDPPFVLEHAEELGLSDKQRAEVGKLAAEYEAQTASLRSALDEARTAAGKKLDPASAQPPRPTDIQEAAQGVSELSSLLAEARAQAWTRLAPTLSGEQQAAAGKAWAEAHALRFAPGSRKGGG